MWKRKNKIKEKKIKLRKCYRCGCADGTVHKTHPFDFEYCEKCKEISLDGRYLNSSKISKEWSYIWYAGIEYNGIEWYKKARDKLIKKIKKINEREEKKKKLKLNKTKEKIDKWK